MIAGYAPTKPCLGCGHVMPVDWFPLANPRADGSRHPMRFCADCLARRCRRGAVSALEKAALQKVRKRESRIRRRRQTGRWS